MNEQMGLLRPIRFDIKVQYIEKEEISEIVYKEYFSKDIYEQIRKTNEQFLDAALKLLSNVFPGCSIKSYEESEFICVELILKADISRIADCIVAEFLGWSTLGKYTIVDLLLNVAAAKAPELYCKEFIEIEENDLRAQRSFNVPQRMFP